MVRAEKKVMEGVFEADFQPCSYGFRPKRSAKQENFGQEIRKWLTKGGIMGNWCRKKRLFWSINHDKLLLVVKKKKTDQWNGGSRKKWVAGREEWWEGWVKWKWYRSTKRWSYFSIVIQHISELFWIYVGISVRASSEQKMIRRWFCDIVQSGKVKEEEALKVVKTDYG